MQKIEHFTERQTQLSAAKQALLRKRLAERATPASMSGPLVLSPRPASETIPLSFAQQRLWFLQQLEPESAAYNEVMFAHMYGPLDVQAFIRAYGEIVRRHQVLCYYFPVRNGQVVQIFDKQIVEHFDIPCHDLRSVPADEREATMERWAQEQVRRPFDLQVELPWRTYLVQLDEQEYVSLSVMHHIVTDGWSWSIFYQEFRALYTAFSRGELSPLPDLPLQYRDYAAWQRQWVESEAAQQQWRYWQRQLAGPLPQLDLPTDRFASESKSARGEQVPVTLPVGLVQEVHAFGKRTGSTPFMVLLAGLLILLYRYTQQEDLVVGTPIAGRTHPEVEHLFGCFLNTLVLRTQIAGNLSVEEVVQRVREVTLAAYDHQEYPFEKLVEQLQPERDLGRTPLVQVLFTLQNMPTEEFSLPGVRWTPFKIENGAAKFALALTLQETEQGLEGYWEYQTDLFDRGSIERLSRHYVQIVRAMLRHPQKGVGELELLIEQVIQAKSVEEVYPIPEECYIDYVWEQVQAQPQAIAVSDEQERVSYAQLWERATRVAAHLQREGVKPEHEELIGIYLERGVTWAVSVLGTLLAGGVYLPLDPSYPVGRVRLMVERSGCRRVLTTRALTARLDDLPAPGRPVQVNCIEDVLEQTEAQAYQPVQYPGTHLAYVIYTSGSTGVPKGVMIEHRGLLNHLLAKVSTLELAATDVVAQTAASSFDISLWQLLAAWLVGGEVHIVPSAVVRDPVTLLRTVQTNHISVLVAVPTLLRALLEEVEQDPSMQDALAQLRWMISTGEALPVEMCRRWLTRYPQIPLVNGYGPTECADNVSQHVLTKEPRAGEMHAPIGRALPHLQLYVLDEQGQPLPVGVWGEIYVGGVGVGRGYLGDPDRTAQAFLPDPWGREAGGRLYRTGDRGRYRANGVIEFGGRRDQQVKLRGYRIELGEIEQALSRCRQIKACVVGVSGEAGREQLVAYVVWGSGEQEDWEGVLQEVGQVLPEYMIPSAVVILDALLLTASGKVDRQALAGMAVRERRASMVGPRTETEEQVAAIWREVLALEQVGVEENFFAIGGHSLQITRVLARISSLFQVNISLRTMFKLPTIAALAKIIEDERSKVPYIDNRRRLDEELRRQGLMPLARDAYRHKRSAIINEAQIK